jgi:uncharacterized protein
MTPQETQLVSDLFDRLAKLENTPRDAAADRLIADGLQRAPHAVYALVQTALVQDEALRRANARIEELQEQTGDAAEAEQRPASFLDTMREALTGRAPARGSVPSVRPQGQSMSQNFQSQDTQPQSGSPPTPPPGYPGSVPPGAGGSFLGNAASTAAGVLGGALLLDGIRSMFGHHPGGGAPSSFGGFGDKASPWNSNAGAANGDLARELGTDQIGQRDYDPRNDRPADVESVADTDDTDDSYDADDDDTADGDDDDFDDDGSGDDSYDV